MTYHYQKFHDLARNARLKRGARIKGSSMYWARLDPDDATGTRVQLGFYWKGWWAVPDPVTGQNNGVYKSLDPKHRPWITELTLAPDHFVVHLQNTYVPKPPPLDPAHLPLYPHYQAATGEREHFYADISLNNLLLLVSNPALRHTGTGNDFPGYKWGFVDPRYYYRWDETEQLNGPVMVSYDGGRPRLDPVKAQPQRVVDTDTRKQINTRLAHLRKNLARLARLGVAISDEEYCAFYGPNHGLFGHGTGPTKDWSSVRAQVTEWGDLDELSARIEALDFTSRPAIVDVAVRCAAAISNSRFHYGQDSHTFMRHLRRTVCAETGLPHTREQTARLRRLLQRHHDVVRYERG